MTDISKFQIQKAADLGIKAFNDGKPSAPCACTELMNMIGTRQIGETPEGEASSVEIMKAFSNSWITANLAAPIPDYN